METLPVLLTLYEGTLTDGVPSQKVKRALVFHLLWAWTIYDFRLYDVDEASP